MSRSASAFLVLAALVLAPGCTAEQPGRDGEILESLGKVTAALERAESRLAALDRRIATQESRAEDTLVALEFLAVDVDGIKRNTWETLQALQSGNGKEEPEAPEEYRRLFEPDTRAALVKAAAEKGVVLKEDRVEVPGVIIQQRAALEFLAVIAGGKEHEAIVALTGNRPHGEGRPEGLAGMINACILALGYTKGMPVMVSKDGKVLPPQGETIHLYVEWDEDGERVRARGEDLVYNLDKKRAMARGKWVYVGSRFQRDFLSSEVVYMADLTGDVAATYSWPNTIVDNVTSEGSDDIYYACYVPRIPELGTPVTMVFSREELPAKDFPDEAESDGGGGSGK